MAGLFNCDWFSFTADFEGYDRELNYRLHQLFLLLDKCRDKPAESDERNLNLGLFEFEVLNHGSRSYYYILHNEDLQIKLARFRSRSATSYPVFVHFKSQFLWSNVFGAQTLQEKFALVIEWLEQLLGHKCIGTKINRLDLCYHTDVIPPNFSADAFVGRHTVDDTRRAHRRLSGVNIGSRKSQKIYLRCYDKFLECRASKKEWFFDIWVKAGMNPRKTWNIEFQLDREFFDETLFKGKRVDSAQQAIDASESIWRYLTNDWITYRIPADEERRTRWDIDPWWEELANYVECGKIQRHKQKTLPTLTALGPGLYGYLTSVAARTETDLEDGTLLKKVHEIMSEYQAYFGKDFEKNVDKKKKLLDPEHK